MSYIDSNGIRYYQFDNYYVVGDNKSSSVNAVSSTSFSGEIIIPESVNGRVIKEIGRYAFDKCRLITKVIIYAKITSINTYSFRDCIGLTYLNIPPTVTFIGYAALFLGIDSESQVIDLAITVEFNKGRTKEIVFSGFEFSFRTKINIIYPYNYPPQGCVSSVFKKVQTTVICAPSEFSFCSKQTTTDSSKCSSNFSKLFERKQNTLSNIKRHASIIILSLLIILLTLPLIKICKRNCQVK